MIMEIDFIKRNHSPGKLTLSQVNFFEHFRFCFKNFLINKSGKKVHSNHIFLYFIIDNII